MTARHEQPEDPGGRRFDGLSRAALVRLAVQEKDSRIEREMVAALVRRDAGRAVEEARRLSRSRVARRRLLAVRICAGLEATERVDDAEPLLARMLDDPKDYVGGTAAVALGMLGRFSKPEYIDRFRRHPDFASHWARQIALSDCAFGFLWGRPTDEAAIQALIELSRDQASGLQRAATFDLATLVEMGHGSPEIIAALRERLKDPDRDTRSHARWGLRYVRRSS